MGRYKLEAFGLGARRVWLALTPTEWALADWLSTETAVPVGQVFEAMLAPRLRQAEYLPDGDWNELVLSCLRRRQAGGLEPEELLTRAQARGDAPLLPSRAGVSLFDSAAGGLFGTRTGPSVVRDPQTGLILEQSELPF